MFRYKYFIVLILFLLFPKPLFAQLDCCIEHGGNYGCDFSTSKLYCADGTVSAKCTCTKSTPTPTPIPTKGPTNTPKPTPTTPPCPSFAKYDSPSNSCKCISGYVANDNVCVTNSEFCWIKYGGNAVFDKDKKTCVCPDGLAFNKNSNKCITLGQLCQELLGTKSYFNSDSNSCTCYQGYAIQDNQCQPIPTKIIAPPQTSISVPTDTPTPTITPSPTLTIKPSEKVFPTLALKGLGTDYSIEELDPQPNILIKIFQSIWNFIASFI